MRKHNRKNSARHSKAKLADLIVLFALISLLLCFLHFLPTSFTHIFSCASDFFSFRRQGEICILIVACPCVCFITSSFFSIEHEARSFPEHGKCAFHGCDGAESSSPTPNPDDWLSCREPCRSDARTPLTVHLVKCASEKEAQEKVNLCSVKGFSFSRKRTFFTFR